MDAGSGSTAPYRLRSDFPGANRLQSLGGQWQLCSLFTLRPEGPNLSMLRPGRFLIALRRTTCTLYDRASFKISLNTDISIKQNTKLHHA